MKNSSFILTLLFCSLVGCGGANYSSSNNSGSNPTTPAGTLGIVQVAKQDCEIVLCASSQPFGFTNPVTPGDSIAVIFWFNHVNGATANSANDNNHDTFNNALTMQQGTNNTMVVYVAKNVYGGATQVSVTGPEANTNFSVAAFELSGVYGDIDATQSQSIFPFSGGLCTSGDINTTHPDVLLGVTLNDVSYSTPITYGSGFAGQFQTYYFAVESQVATTTGSYQATFSTGPPPTQQPYYIATTGVVAIY
jgi:hypothetical protein